MLLAWTLPRFFRGRCFTSLRIAGYRPLLIRNLCLRGPQTTPVKRFRAAKDDDEVLAVVSPPLSPDQLGRIQRNKQAALQKLATRSVPEGFGETWKEALSGEFVKPYFAKQVQEALQMRYTGPGHSLEPGSWVLIRNFERKTALAPRWRGPYQVLLARQTAIRVDGRKAWIHATHARRFPASLKTLPDPDDEKKTTVSETKETVASPVPQHQPEREVKVETKRKREVKLETEPEEAASKGEGRKVPQHCSAETSLPNDANPALQTRAETTRAPLWRPPVLANAPKPEKETTSLPRRPSLPIIVPQADT
ncbi:uracil-DNA glycosylase isoform X4 [Ambystoma mexicanum]|uniref:uracil-DNA glycosylase isoform X4 n=1 Tax=Ambystoma mexicanum TaxID=8296 RepID=UPI0037E74B0F